MVWRDLSGGYFMLKHLLVIIVVFTCAAAHSQKEYVDYGDYEHLILGDKHKFLEYFEAYVRSNPDNESAKRLLENIKSGKGEVKRR
jgi:hypothetical protein